VEDGSSGGGGGGIDGSGGGGSSGSRAAQRSGPAGTAAADPATSSLVFLYRLAEGRAAPSFGVHCAQLAGVPPPVLERARAVIAVQVGRVQHLALLSSWVQCSALLVLSCYLLSALSCWTCAAAHDATLGRVEPLTWTELRLASCLQATGQPVAAVQGGQHAQRAAAYRSLVQRLLTLDVRDGAAVQQLVGAVLQATSGGGGHESISSGGCGGDSGGSRHESGIVAV